MIHPNSGKSKIMINSPFLKKCNIPCEKGEIEPFAIVIFGGTGDLARKMILPTLYHLFIDGELDNHFVIIGTGRSMAGDDEYRKYIKNILGGLKEQSNDLCLLDEFIQRVHFFQMDIRNAEKYIELERRIESITERKSVPIRNVILYLAISPEMIEDVILSAGKLNENNGRYRVKVIVEKPFGTDRKSAVYLNNLLQKYFSEKDIFRIDHYLGKETVQNIIFLRFSNSILEPLWNNKYIDNIQLTVAESIGIENRGEYYNKAGVIRDMIQNHMMQLIALIAMEPPSGFEADFVRDEKLKVFRSFRPHNEESCRSFILGQYTEGMIDGSIVNSYREEPHVTDNSTTSTFIAGKFYIDNWRWAGVPFYIRSGKRLKRRVTEICIEFKQPPLRLFGRTCDSSYPNLLVITVQPEEEIKLRLGIKYPGRDDRIFLAELSFNYVNTFNIHKHPAYERLILDCFANDLTLFARQDSVEAMWEIVDPVIRYADSSSTRIYPYTSGSWGPEEADGVVEEEGKLWYTE